MARRVIPLFTGSLRASISPETSPYRDSSTLEGSITSMLSSLE
uniref:Uncharacterized protein n=1 Tax=Nelumbo nucifera TaxID=4432 RepID=A0A822ZAA8_NELNU|nr:TPA_asm: hypothetical protein HUJ06_014682 [Nelumbo nucifera]